VKQKWRACAAFLGVLAIPKNVVRGCCIPITFLSGFRAALNTVENPEIQRFEKPTQRTGSNSAFANQSVRESGIGRLMASNKKEGRSGGGCGLAKTRPANAWLVLITAVGRTGYP
jgi:hypothetical protein